mmetsp:Transcript_9054/g.23042  ORF Transcript_9054/g.23042 Transcript_9054/m.23042 type:complete len:179 (+) Transcript_9054:78-614(+)|eukprot:CAMPEP_0202038280 /NCGR_PEP_ID=MMETSP0962-20130828/8238_1 /ASSEMBLY_ACC=CAM_ASM_000488 /TAXON_ID=4773 /ORGANISM="Schizochytrium aggregatum, Strain ATCC28209" /LENGTH=178 /DNA_ID=CAMNT_0048602433 /DNA_START=55 /DNA_END=591 /DNA_ORIENTATION=+
MAAAAAAGAATRRVLVYEGPFGPTLRMLKRVSVFSCGCTLLGVPLLSVFGNEEMEVVQRAAVGFTVCSFAIGTTAALTWVSRPYIWRMYRLQAHGTNELAKLPRNTPLQLESFNLLGRVKVTDLPNGLEDVEPCRERVFVNFGIKGRQAMYMHEEADCYADQDLYEQVMKTAQISPSS